MRTMTNVSQAPDFAFHALAFALPADGAPPQWITIFPSLGDVETRDGRKYTVDANAVIAHFDKHRVDIPIDINHATAIAAKEGKSAPAVGWISQLRVENGSLQGKVDWLDEGKALLAAKSYRFVSPDFFHTPQGVTRWIRSVALVTAPALGNQPALAGATHTQNEDKPMKTIAAALGLNDDASEASCLAALKEKLDASVPKNVHDATLSQLSAATTKLTAIETEGRKAKVNALIEGALKEKKILPAEKDHYVALCATDEGLGAVSNLFAAKAVVLPASGLDTQKTPEGGGALTAAQLAAAAGKLVADSRATGGDLSIADAMTMVTQKSAA